MAFGTDGCCCRCCMALLQPLLPASEEQASSRLPLPLLRFKEAVRVLDPDPRFHRLPEDLRRGWAGGWQLGRSVQPSLWWSPQVLYA